MRRGAGLGIIIVAVGVLYLLNATGVIHMTPVWWSGAVLWPLLLVLLGGSGLHEFRRGKIPIWSLFFIVLGLGLSARATGLFPWLTRISDGNLFWALLIIFFGLNLLMPRRWRGPMVPVVVIHGGKRHKKEWDGTAGDKDKWKWDGDVVDGDIVVDAPGKRHKDRYGDRGTWRLIGDLSVGGHPWVLKDMEMWNGVGDIRVNLATAHVEDGDYHIEIGGWIGDVRVLVPSNLDVAVDAGVSIGDLVVFDERHSGTGRHVHFEEPGFADSTRRVTISVSLKIGDVRIVRV
ncbi:cell wall-active antibiotics response protein LiaF [Alicyclobacillus sp. ALC3]|uniref:cell wall-active antibiotics response protein LiaF n=1 Tax=Alicyclobacillus sp. ALC3 TaxID=2796143 RepID=UPI0023793779|nr:cell wall-active antibiotics response protein LiaF [Alicyclobacillus sp. ALC3]WDL99046.1 cell wall-active antibiotics response protein [Alicyclobacillus sp. ALC3]